MNFKVSVSEATNDDNYTSNYVVQQRYNIQEGQYGIWETKGDNMYFMPKGAAVYIEKIINHIDSGLKYYILQFKDAQGRQIKIEFPRKELTETGIMALLAYGAQVTKQDARALISSIFNQEPETPCILQHERLGFCTYNNKLIFLGKKAEGIDSDYSGELQIGRTGKYSLWKRLITENVLGHVPMEFALAVGGAGVVTDYLRHKTPIENLLVHLVGDSSTGKTTAALLMISCGAKPSMNGNSVVMTFADTPNAIMNAMQSSYTTLIDEGSLCGYKPTDLLYSLACGEEKKRLKRDLTKAETVHFNTAVVTTSEKSLINMSDEYSGLLVRNIEIQGVEWTQDAQTADEIKSVILNNYGFLVPKIARKIIELEEAGKEDVMDYFEYWKERFIELAQENGQYNSLVERASKQYAIILTAAELIQRVMKIELQLEEILIFLQEHSLVKDTERTNIGQRALDFMLQYMEHHYSQFVTPKDIDYAPTNCLGRIAKVRQIRLKNGMLSERRLYVSDIILDKILQEGAFPDKKIILAKWKEAGYLKSEKDRYISDINIIGDVFVKGYVINLPITCKIGEKDVDTN